MADILGAASKSKNAEVQRSTWEALLAVSPTKAQPLEGNWTIAKDRRVRAARVLAVAKGWTGVGEDFAARFDPPDSRKYYAIDSLWHDYYKNGLKPPQSPHLLMALISGLVPPEERNDAIRLLMLMLGDVSIDPADKERLAGYSFAERSSGASAPSTSIEEKRIIIPLAKALADFRKIENLEPQERARLLAMLADPASADAIEPIAALLTADSSPVDDIHYLMCLSRMPGERSEAARKNIAAGIALLDSKMKSRGWYPSRNWPDRVGETFAALAKHDPELPAAVIEHEAFKSPSQAFLFTRLEKEHQAAAARKLLKSIRESDDERWTSELVALVAALPAAESLPALRQAWEDVGVRDAVLLQLAKAPDAADRERFAESLGSIDPVVIEKAAQALEKLNLQPSDDDWLSLMQSLRQSCSAPPAKAAREALVALATQWSRQELEIKEQEKGEQLLADYQPWFAWFAQEHPALSKKLSAASGDAATWRERLARLDWESGDAARGRLSYEQRSCIKCHAGTSPLGPDLTGAAGRLSREDLVAAIVDPSKDVSPLYQSTQIVTAAGRIYHGLVVYESPDGTLLTTGPDTTIRIAGDEIVSMAKSRLSLMPTGLLDKADDQELADLVAYLQTLKGKR